MFNVATLVCTRDDTDAQNDKLTGYQPLKWIEMSRSRIRHRIVVVPIIQEEFLGQCG